MNENPLLEQLNDIELPASVPFWYAPGWLALVLLAGLLLTMLVCWLWQWRRQRSAATRWKAQARDALAEVYATRAAGDESEALAQLSRLLRRVVLQHEQRADVAALTGASWIAKLEQLFQSAAMASGRKDSVDAAVFSASSAQLLTQARYQSQAVSRSEFEALLKQSTRWLRGMGVPVARAPASKRSRRSAGAI